MCGELAGDEGWTQRDRVAEIHQQTSTLLRYQNLSDADFKATLLSVDLPEDLAAMLANTDIGASKGSLFDDNHSLRQPLGRPTVPLNICVKSARLALDHR